MTSFDRRDFLRASLTGLGAISLGAKHLSAATPAWLRDLPEGDNVLVIVELAGGNDGLNTLVPFENDDYHRARPTLGMNKDRCLPLVDGIGLAGDMKGMKALYDAGQLAIVQGAGYPNPNRSHFKSMDIWHSADPTDAMKKSGWLGRVADACCEQHPDPEFTINLGQKTPLALQGERTAPISFQDPNAYRFLGSAGEMSAFKAITQEDKSETEKILDIVGRTAANARTTSDVIRKAATSYSTPVSYPNARLGSALKVVASLIDARLSTRIYYAYLGGFDTHTNQAQRQPRLLQELDSSLAAFQSDLQRIHADRRVTTMVFSEFGRRVKENASRGTDHGTAAPMFVLGARVRGGLFGKYPSLTDLDKGDLKFTTDFRSVYAALLQDWLHADAERVLGAKLARLPLFAV